MSESTFYKYRGVENWAYVLDILEKQRLYAAPFQALNDPMEGFFIYPFDRNQKASINLLKCEKQRLKICSLSNTYTSMLMWSYYASSHKGLVFEVASDEEPKRIIYSSAAKLQRKPKRDITREAEQLLLRKINSFTHENEYRVLTHEKFVKVSIRKIYLGALMDCAKQKEIQDIAKQKSYQVEKMCIRLLDCYASLGRKDNSGFAPEEGV